MKKLILIFLLLTFNAFSLTFKSDGTVIKNDGSIEESKISDNNQENPSIKKEKYLINQPGLIFIDGSDYISNLKKFSPYVYYVCNDEGINTLELPNHNVDLSEWDSFEMDMEENQTLYFSSYCDHLANSDENFDTFKYDLIENIDNGAYSKLTHLKDNDDLNYSHSINLMPLLLYYSFSKDDYSKEEQKKVETWLYNLTIKHKKLFNRPDNHKFYYLNYALAHSIVFDDAKLFNDTINDFRQTLSDAWTPEGFFKKEAERGSCALHYNYHSLNPIFGFLYNLKIQGIDLYKEKFFRNFDINDIVDAIYEVTIDTSPLTKYSIKNNAGDTCVPGKGFSDAVSKDPKIIYNVPMPSQNGWMLIYRDMFGEDKIEKFIKMEINNEKVMLFNSAKKNIGASNNSLGGIPCIYFLTKDKNSCLAL